VAALVDTNVLVYSFDPRFPEKRERARRLIAQGLARDELRLPHQAVVEFVAAVTRPGPGAPKGLLSVEDALLEAEGLLDMFQVLYPSEALVRQALRGMALYRFAWFDAHLWAYAELHGLPVLYSEDFEHGKRYGTVEIVDPFL
jgi:predicted nucleic acid-binding protein